MRSVHLSVVAASAALAFAAPAAAQVIDTAQGSIEFVGLRKWTPVQLDEAVTARCNAHYCAADLERVLGFAKSAVFTLPEGEPVRKLIVLVEDPEHVRTKPRLEGEGTLPERWSALAPALAPERSLGFDLAVRHYPLLLADGETAARAKVAALDWATEEIPTIEAVWTFLAAHSDPRELPLALWHLEHDPSVDARRVAAAVLMGFHTEDVAWWALADGMRDADDRVNGVCWAALRSLAQHRARRVDWAPAAPALRAVLAGTHCFGLPDLCEALARTEVDPRLAPAILTGGGELVLALADCRASFARERVRALLAHLTGEPRDAETAAFRAALARRETATTESAAERTPPMPGEGRSPR